jgi:tetratricopeptide (TPR) repeat protein
MRPAYLVMIGLLAIGAGWVLASPKSLSQEASPAARAKPSPTTSVPSPVANQTAWRELLKQRQFDELDQRLTALQADVEAGKCQECAATGPYYEFSTSDPIIGDRLDEWVKARPESLPAHIARGMYRNHVSGLARGVAYAAKTHSERFAEMTRLHKAAVEDLYWVVRRNPKASLAYAQLIYIATAQGGDTAAAKVYAEAIAHNPDSPVIYRARAWSLAPWWQGVLPRAAALKRLKAYIADLEQRFGDRTSFAWLAGYADYMEAETRARTGDYDGAISYYTKALAAAERASYLVGRADAYYRKYGYDRLEAQQADLERALEIAPKYADALHDMGQLKIHLCRHAKAAKATNLAVCQEATDVLDRAVNEDPLDPSYLSWRAMQLALVGRSEDARRDLDQARIYGEYDPFLQSLAGDVLAGCDHASAKEAYQRAVALTPDDSRYLKDYLQFLMVSGDCAFFEALSSYTRVCEKDKSCRPVTNPPKEELKFFQERRGRSCAVETWHEPRASLVLPD